MTRNGCLASLLDLDHPSPFANTRAPPILAIYQSTLYFHCLSYTIHMEIMLLVSLNSQDHLVAVDTTIPIYIWRGACCTPLPPQPHCGALGSIPYSLTHTSRCKSLSPTQHHICRSLTLLEISAQPVRSRSVSINASSHWSSQGPSRSEFSHVASSTCYISLWV